MTPAEQLVGRRLPPPASHLDTLLASFVKIDGTFCGRLQPTETWLQPAHRKARKSGLIKHSGMSVGFSPRKNDQAGLYFLTTIGEAAASGAKARVIQRESERRQWASDHGKEFRLLRSRTS